MDEPKLFGANEPAIQNPSYIIRVVANAHPCYLVEVWLSSFFHWKKDCELFAKANARDDDSSTKAG